MKGIVCLSAIAFLSSACSDEEEVITFQPGNRLVIIGESAIHVGDEGQTYYVQNNSWDLDYDWSIASETTLEKDERNDAFVYIDFPELGVYTLEANNGSATGAMEIAVESRELGFTASEMEVTEGLENDTLAIPLTVTGDLRGSVELEYTISGSIDPANYAVVEGYESPLTLTGGGTPEIKVVLLPETDADEVDLVVSLDDLTPTLADEYIFTDSVELKSITYSIANDTKYVSMDTVKVELDSVAGVFSYPVVLSNPSTSSVEVAYTIGTDDGITDATATNRPNVLVFSPEETEKNIVLSINILAFEEDKDIPITLTSVSSDDDEVMMSLKVSKVLEIDIEE